MEEKLIIAVAAHRVLYDVSMHEYRNNKSLRDAYRKERMRSGAGASQVRAWRYSHIMTFLNPFMEDIGTSGNMPGRVVEASLDESQELEEEEGEDAASTTASATASAPASATTSLVGDAVNYEEGDEAEVVLLMEPVPNEPVPTPSTSKEKPKKRTSKEMTDFERLLAGEMGKAIYCPAPSAPTIDPDEHFFKSFMPELKAMSAKKKAKLKQKIHKAIYETSYESSEED